MSKASLQELLFEKRSEERCFQSHPGSPAGRATPPRLQAEPPRLACRQSHPASPAGKGKQAARAAVRAEVLAGQEAGRLQPPEEAVWPDTTASTHRVWPGTTR